MRRTLPLVLTLVIGSIIIINSYFKIDGLATFVVRYINRTQTLSLAWAIGLGSVNLMRIQTNHVRRKAPNWQYSIVLIATFIFFLVFGLIVVGNHNNPVFAAVWNSVQPPLDTTLFCLLCFYIASAAFRSFRMRKLEASVMMLAAFIIMLGAVPIGASIWSGMPVLSGWIMRTINTSSLRAMTMGITLGALSQSIRNLIGVERSYMAE